MLSRALKIKGRVQAPPSQLRWPVANSLAVVFVFVFVFVVVVLPRKEADALTLVLEWTRFTYPSEESPTALLAVIFIKSFYKSVRPRLNANSGCDDSAIDFDVIDHRETNSVRVLG